MKDRPPVFRHFAGKALFFLVRKGDSYVLPFILFGWSRREAFLWADWAAFSVIRVVITRIGMIAIKKNWRIGWMYTNMLMDDLREWKRFLFEASHGDEKKEEGQQIFGFGYFQHMT